MVPSALHVKANSELSNMHNCPDAVYMFVLLRLHLTPVYENALLMLLVVLFDRCSRLCIMCRSASGGG